MTLTRKTGLILSGCFSALIGLTSATHAADGKTGEIEISPVFATNSQTTARGNAVTRAGNVIRSGFDAMTLSANDDGSAQATNLGFTINFFGNSYSQTYVNNNGNLTFRKAIRTFTALPFSSAEFPIIAPFWADVDTRAGNLTRYGTGTVDGHPAFGATWIDVGYYSSHRDKVNSFQVILIDRSDTGTGNFDIEYNYEQVQWETGDESGGSGGLGGNSVRVGYSNGKDVTFELEGSAVNGALIDGGANALISHQSNSGIDGRYLFNVREVGEGSGAGVLQFSNFSYSVNENAGTVDIIVNRVGGSEGDISVDVLTINGSVFNKSTLKWADGDSTDKIISLDIIDDDVSDGNEMIMLLLENAIGATIGSPASAILTIIDDDADDEPLGLPDAGVDNTKSLGKFGIRFTQAKGQEFLGVNFCPGDPTNPAHDVCLFESPVLSDDDTSIGRSDPHLDADVTDETKGAQICIMEFNGICIFFPDTIKDSDFAVVPNTGIFTEGPSNTTEIHTQILSFNMKDSGNCKGESANAIRAGSAAPDMPRSIGEVESLNVDGFPAESFFNIFVEVDVDWDMNGTVDMTAININPLVIQNDELNNLPPRVVYTHGGSENAPAVYDKKTGEMIGWITLAGHGVGLDSMPLS